MDKLINKNTLVSEISQRTEIPEEQVLTMIEEFQVQLIEKMNAESKIYLSDLGVFFGRESRDKTKIIPKFKASKRLKEKLNS